ncbi:MAG TPA: ABC transporter ATP-binding protein/permease [Lapidilactobacillus dextrinicus]|uniref:ABC transporter ATP-binding protein/permease n=1 Tax=Lapidilactobacillus dextrinicus TaxID=51664 RepID=A0A921DUY1_9LACO|nr:ABC transporter ATP-binding protein/permease [Lapidilactobacillus dextrinicus]
MWKLRRFLIPYRRQATLGALFKFIEVVCELLLPSLMAIIVDQGVKTRNTHFVVQHGLLMIGMAIFGLLSASVCQYFAARSAQGYGTDLRRSLFAHITKLSYQQQDEFGAATLTTRLTNDVNQMQLWVAMSIRQVSRAPFMIIGSLLMAFIMDRHLALILLIATPILGLVVYWLTTRMSPLYRRYQSQLDHLSAVVKENLSGVRVIRAFAKTDTETAKFNDANTQQTETGLKIGRLSAIYNPMTATVVNLMTIAILWASGSRINLGTLDQGTVLAFINYVNMILSAVLMLSNLVILLTKAMASAARVNEIMATEPAIISATTTTQQLEEKQDPILQYQHVSFYADSDQADQSDAILKDINFVVNDQETIGIIGGTGSGKSTLINLLPRLKQFSTGEIKLFGQSISALSLPQLRSLISIVPQHVDLFSGTIASNLRFGNPEATDQDLTDALATAQATAFVDQQALGLNAPVERDGRNFSGGQRQRIAIARALVKQAPILLLDDATSALDYLTEAHFREALKQQSWLRGTLIISQRVGTVMHADRVLVLKNGRVVGFDTHEALLKDNYYYQELVASQLDQDEAGE